MFEIWKMKISRMRLRDLDNEIVVVNCDYKS